MRHGRPTTCFKIWVFQRDKWVKACQVCAHFCITTALQLAPATIVTPFEFLRLPLITFVGVLLYGEALEWPVFIGAFVVLAANILNIHAEIRAKPVSENKAVSSRF